MASVGGDLAGDDRNDSAVIRSANMQSDRNLIVRIAHRTNSGLHDDTVDVIQDAAGDTGDEN